MDDDRASPCRGELHLLRERLLLLFAGRVVIIIIQADLAYGEYVGTGQERVQLGERSLIGELGFMGVDTGGGKDAGDFGFAGIAAA